MHRSLFTMSLDELVLVGHYHLTALSRTDETKGLVSTFAPVLDVLEGAWGMDRRAQRDLNRAIAPVIVAESRMRDTIERLASLARSSGGAESPAYRTLFPMGMDVELAQHGESHLTLAMSLRERLVSQPGLADVKAQVIADVDNALTTLSAAIATRENAERWATRVREHAEKSRADFLAAYERDAAAIESLFPGDPVRQDVYFDERWEEDRMMAVVDEGWPSAGKKDRGKPS